MKEIIKDGEEVEVKKVAPVKVVVEELRKAGDPIPADELVKVI